MAEPEPAPWPGTEFVECLQVACGAFVDGRSDGEVAHRVTAAVESVSWQSLSSAEFFVARGILMSFLIRLSNRRPHPLAAIATLILERLASADAGEIPAIVTDALRSRFGADSGQPATARDWRVRHTLALVTRSFHCTIRVSDLARDVGLSKWHLERLTKQATGRPLRVHLAEARMASAMRLLGERRSSVKEVSARVGYGNPDSFRRDFKRHYGMTPHAWLIAQTDRSD
jgi:AraC-like DNA-binding protein